MKKGYVFAHNGKMYVVIGTCIDGISRKPRMLCQEMQEGGNLVTWPDSILASLESTENHGIISKEPEPDIENSDSLKNPLEEYKSEKNQLQEDLDNGIMNRSAEPGSSEVMMEAFFDADSVHDKLELLRSMKNQITENMLSSLAISMDFELSEGDLDEQYYSFERFLRTRVHFEGRRPH